MLSSGARFHDTGRDDMPELFDKHDKPVLAGLTEEEVWAQVHAFEDYVYSTFSGDDTVSDE
jgi:hypothetical protein